MKAIEFTTIAKDGIIEIPKKYQSQLQQAFRVIILHEASHEQGNDRPEKKVPRKQRELVAAKIKTKRLKFAREEANARY